MKKYQRNGIEFALSQPQALCASPQSRWSVVEGCGVMSRWRARKVSSLGGLSRYLIAQLLVRVAESWFMVTVHHICIEEKIRKCSPRRYGIAIK